MATRTDERQQHQHHAQANTAPVRGATAMAVIDPDEDQEGIVTSGTGIEAAQRGEIDVQIATAHKYPRLLKRSLARARDMATLDEETAARCFYVVPRDGKHIEGPSIRLAEIFASAWGNFRCGSRIVDEGERMVTVQGYAHDLETNLAVAVELQRRITKKNGQRFSDDMIVTTLNAAQSIALRNAILRVIPRVYVDAVFREAKKVAVGDVSTLVERRAAAVAWFAKAKVSEAQLLVYLGKASLDEVGLEELAVLKGLSTAIHEGSAKIDTLFPPIAAPGGTTPPVSVAQAADAQVARAAAEAKAKKQGKPATPPAREPGADDEPPQTDDGVLLDAQGNPL